MTATETATLTASAKLSSLKAGLKPALEIATKGTLKDHADSNRITLEFKQSEIIAYAYGGRLASTVVVSNMTDGDLAYSCDEEGKVTVNASDFIRSLDSFPQTERIAISATENELTLSRENDSEEVQKMPVAKDEVVVPTTASTFQKEIKIDRQQFINGVNDVSWAVGFEDHKENYFYVRLIAKPGVADFMGGTGGRFRIWNVKGDKFIDVKERTEFFFHKDQVPPLVAILKAVSGTDADYITIKQAERDNDTPDQIIFETGNLKIMFVGFDPNVKWPNIEKSIKDEKPNVVETNVADWEYATKGLMATFNEDVKKAHDTHESAFEPKLDKNFILLTSKTGMKSSRKVPILRIVSQGENTEGLEFNCTTQYIAEVFSKCEKADKVFVQYHDRDDKPVFIVGPANKNDATGITTQYTLFFASMKV